MPKNIVGHVSALFISSKGNSTRKRQSLILLDKDGILQDKFYKKNISRSVLLSSESSYGLASQHNINMPWGSLGENILMDFNPYTLLPGTQMHIGNTILEISQICTICDHLSEIDKQLPTLLKNDRGIFAKVIQAGEIKEGDSITVSSSKK